MGPLRLGLGIFMQLLFGGWGWSYLFHCPHGFRSCDGSSVQRACGRFVEEENSAFAAGRCAGRVRDGWYRVWIVDVFCGGAGVRPHARHELRTTVVVAAGETREKAEITKYMARGHGDF